ncbi:MAG: DUF2786 domain-containing protein, partial [Mycobacteriales bacterium]
GWWQAQSAPPIELLTGLIWNAALNQTRGDAALAVVTVKELTDGQYAANQRLVDSAADLALRQTLTQLWAHGWQPYDVFQIANRRLSQPGVGLVVDAIAGEIEQRAAAGVHRQWRDQLDQIDGVVWWQPDRPQLGQWAQKHGYSQAEALTLVIAVLAVLLILPMLPEIPLPKQDRARAGVDEKMLAKVRALLAKAESTQFPEEAEAMSAKAQELMSRYSFERALVDADGESAKQGTGRRFWLDAPYLPAKSSLVSAVARANRCRAVSYDELGFVALVGHEFDLDVVELLSTSLLVQATEAMLRAGTHVTHTGQSRTRSFRQSFLLAYAGRIGERLTEADRATGEQVADKRLLPILARRTREVDELFETMFPEVTMRSQSVSNGAGWNAGRSAADTAKLNIERNHITAAP